MIRQIQFKKSRNSDLPSGQLSLPVPRVAENDRNFDKGGRSFYFFDFDDNIINLSTPIVLFDRETGSETFVSSKEFAQVHSQVGHPGPYENFELRLIDSTGTFRHFRDKPFSLGRLFRRTSHGIVEDIKQALKLPLHEWQGPSWNCFYHAVFNRRPMSLITARGHSPKVLKLAIMQLVLEGHLPHEPNYLEIVPVSHPRTRKKLARTIANEDVDVSNLKRAAIRLVFKKALLEYGYSSYHRFGFSDDDPKNVKLIKEELFRLKTEYPKMGFFIISTVGGSLHKDEIHLQGQVETTFCLESQQNLFE